MIFRTIYFALGGILAFLAVACSQETTKDITSAPPTATSMAGMQSADLAPLVSGFYRGEDILFIHTEASDAQVADMLTDMMGRKVMTVPSLAQVPESLLADVYVFTNGVSGGGPFGFQPDVFDAVPGDEGYSPLRVINLAKWEEDVTARQLRSAEEVRTAESRGEVTVTRTGIVVNMPILAWSGDHR